MIYPRAVWRGGFLLPRHQLSGLTERGTQMRNLNNNIDKINRKADNDKARIDKKRYAKIGRAMMCHQDEIDKLKRMILKLDIQMSVAKLDPCAAEALGDALAERKHRREQAAKRAEKKRAAQRAESKRAAQRAAADAAATTATAADAAAAETTDEVGRFLRLFRG
jgi:hypothetical protein